MSLFLREGWKLPTPEKLTRERFGGGNRHAGPVSLRARVFDPVDGAVAMQPGETGFSLADLQTSFSPNAASSSALIPSRTPLLPVCGSKPEASAPPPQHRCSDNEMHAHASLVHQAIITHPAQLFCPHPSALHPLHGGFLVSALCSYPSSSVNQSSSHSLVHPSIHLPGRPSPLPRHRSLRSIHLHASLVQESSLSIPASTPKSLQPHAPSILPSIHPSVPPGSGPALR